MPGRKNKSNIPAGLYYRSIAAFFDLGTWVLLWFFTHHALVSSPNSSTMLIRMIDKLIIPVIMIYYILFEWLWEATLGKMIVKIKVKPSDKNKITLLQAIMRNTTKLISLILFFVGYLVILFRKDKRALHDILSKCRVIRLPKYEN